MKRIFVVGLFIALMTCFVLVNANAETAGQGKTGLSKEQTEQLKSQLEGLKEVFGIEKEPQAQPSQNQQQQKKTVADVADKALDMVNKMVADTAATLNNVAPSVWRIMMKQQYAYAISNLIAPWFCFLGAFIFLVVMRKHWNKPPDRVMAIKVIDGRDVEKEVDNSENVITHMLITTAGPITAMLFCALWGISRLADSVPVLINPEFYAIKNLILILLGKG